MYKRVLSFAHPNMEEQPSTTLNNKGRLKNNAASVLRWVKRNLKTFLAMVGVASGVVVGFVFRESLPSEDRLQLLLAIPGELLLRMLRVLTLPMILSSAISASSEIKPVVAAKMMTQLTALAMINSLFAAMIGVAAAGIVHPGSEESIESSGFYIEDSSYWLHLFMDYFRNGIPENIVRASFQHSRTVPHKVDNILWDQNVTEDTPLSASEELVIDEGQEHFVWKTEYRFGISLLGLVLTSTTFGLMSGQPSHSNTVVQIFTVLHKITLKMSDLIMWYFPVGVASLITADVLLTRDSSLAASQVALLIIAMGIASAAHACLLLPLSYWFLTGRNPFVLFRNLFFALVVAFGASSSTACLPITVRCMDEQEGTHKRANRILLPLGSAICLDGAAIYGSVVSIFLLQMNGVQLDIGHFIYLGLAAFVLAFASPILPLFGVVYLAQLMTNYVDVHHCLLVFSADWIVCRIRSLVNVWSSAIGSATVCHFNLYEIKDWSKDRKQNNNVPNDEVPGCSTSV